MDFDLNSIPELVSGENEPPVHHFLVDDEDISETYFPINPTDTSMEIPAINLDDTFDFETMYTAGDAGSLQAHNVTNDEMQVFDANDEMQVFEANDEMQKPMMICKYLKKYTMHTSVATGATTAIANTISISAITGLSVQQQVPYLTFSFNSEEEARAHYNRYAKRVGFSIKINTSRKSAKDGERDKVMFVCNKCGPGERTGEACPPKKRKRSRTRQAACKARMTVKRKGARWEVIQFVEEHTHPLVRKFSLKKFLRSHRAILKEEKDFITMLHGVNLSAGRIMQLMSELYGGPRNVPYTRKDISNFKSKLGSEYRCRDIPQTIAHFEEIKKDDPNFFYKIQLDKEDRVQNIFWVDGAARNTYKDFKNCISFDCTYMTNMYNMPCAPFIGINRHGQSIQLGCGFLRNEKTETFAMEGVEPTNIITDQDLAMKAAIALVFPHAKHRNCRWHIMQNAQKKIGHILDHDKALCDAFNDCLDNSWTEQEFDAKWDAMLETYHLEDNEHFRHLWDMRHEGFNAVLKRYVNPQNSIYNFFLQYKKIQEKITVATDQNEFEAEETIPSIWGNYPMETKVLEIYTRPIFNRFQKELIASTSYKLTRTSENMYLVESNGGPIRNYGSKAFIVAGNVLDRIYICECCKFERDGILCCHVLKVMTSDFVGQVSDIPEHYILPRWMMVKEPELPPVTSIGEQMQLPPESLKLIRYTNLCTKFTQIAKDASSNEKAYRMALQHMSSMTDDIAAMKQSRKKQKKAQPAPADPATGILDIPSASTNLQYR
uniref:SWIM-type domain-containing protein n=1 Tax=Oryza punctata TaxID=4537 RepID=A0A0E0LY81_ORYPU